MIKTSTIDCTINLNQALWYQDLNMAMTEILTTPDKQPLSDKTTEYLKKYIASHIKCHWITLAIRWVFEILRCIFSPSYKIKLEKALKILSNETTKLLTQPAKVDQVAQQQIVEKNKPNPPEEAHIKTDQNNLAIPEEEAKVILKKLEPLLETLTHTSKVPNSTEYSDTEKHIICSGINALRVINANSLIDKTLSDETISEIEPKLVKYFETGFSTPEEKEQFRKEMEDHPCVQAYYPLDSNNQYVKNEEALLHAYNYIKGMQTLKHPTADSKIPLSLPRRLKESLEVAVNAKRRERADKTLKSFTAEETQTLEKELKQNCGCSEELLKNKWINERLPVNSEQPNEHLTRTLLIVLQAKNNTLTESLVVSRTFTGTCVRHDRLTLLELSPYELGIINQKRKEKADAILEQMTPNECYKCLRQYKECKILPKILKDDLFSLDLFKWQPLQKSVDRNKQTVYKVEIDFDYFDKEYVPQLEAKAK